MYRIKVNGERTNVFAMEMGNTNTDWWNNVKKIKTKVIMIKACRVFCGLFYGVLGDCIYLRRLRTQRPFSCILMSV